jgi:hypothetical protein
MNTDIDLIAEREAAAIERLADLVGDTLPSPIEKSVRQPRYNRTASYRAHHSLQHASMKTLVYGPVARYPDFVDRYGREAKAIRRLRQSLLLSSVGWVGIAVAAERFSVGHRTLQRAALRGRLLARKDYTPAARNGVGATGRWLVRLDDVAALVARQRPSNAA